MVVAVTLPVAVLQAYQKWDVRCCTLEEFAGWYEQAQRAWRLQDAAVSDKLFCLDGASAWCAEQRAAGRCALAMLPLF